MNLSSPELRHSLQSNAHLFLTQQRQRDTIALLKHAQSFPLTGKRILEIGCGMGNILQEYLAYSPDSLHGADILENSIAAARHRHPHVPLTRSNASALPYLDNTFDVVLQYTVFSSILDDRDKARVAEEMCRVLRPDGLIIWYDFWINPTNPNTRGIRPDEIRRLFSGSMITARRVTLAPPLTRRLINVSWLFCALLEKMRIFNSHYLALITPNK